MLAGGFGSSVRCVARSLPCAIWLLFLVTASCRAVVDFDEPTEAAAAQQTRPLLPFVPEDALAEGCASCAMDGCSEERELCLSDVTCRGLLACRSRCKDPACMARCGSFTRFGGGSVSSNGIPTAPESRAYEVYEGCVSGSCRGPCGIGLNWDCLGSATYRWPRDLGGDLPVQLEVLDRRAYAPTPASVEAYGLGDTFLDRGETGAWGQVTLNLNARSTFAGYFTIIPKLDGLVSELYYPGTLFRPTRLAAPILFAPSPVTPKPGLAGAVFSVRDCLGRQATGVSFQLEELPGDAWYLLAESFVQNKALTTNDSGTGGINNLMPQQDLVYVNAIRADRTVARAGFRLREDSLSLVELWPLSGAD